MKTKRLSNMNAVEGTFGFDGVTYDRKALSPVVNAYLATLGLQAVISRAEKPDEVYAELKAGTVKMAPSGPRYTDIQRAAASAHALAVCSATGVKCRAGKMRETEEYAAALAEALARPWNGEAARRARSHPKVLEELHLITGATIGDVSSLFDIPDPAVPAPLSNGLFADAP